MERISESNSNGSYSFEKQRSLFSEKFSRKKQEKLSWKRIRCFFKNIWKEDHLPEENLLKSEIGNSNGEKEKTERVKKVKWIVSRKRKPRVGWISKRKGSSEEWSSEEKSQSWKEKLKVRIEKQSSRLKTVRSRKRKSCRMPKVLKIFKPEWDVFQEFSNHKWWWKVERQTAQGKLRSAKLILQKGGWVPWIKKNLRI